MGSRDAGGIENGRMAGQVVWKVEERAARVGLGEAVDLC